MRDFRKLEAFRQADWLVPEIYRLTAHFPHQERWGMVSQIRRSATSIPTNIVEGSARRSEKDFRHFLYVALGSSRELGYLLHLSRQLGFVSNQEIKQFENRVSYVSALLAGLIRHFEPRKKKKSNESSTP